LPKKINISDKTQHKKSIQSVSFRQGFFFLKRMHEDDVKKIIFYLLIS